MNRMPECLQRRSILNCSWSVPKREKLACNLVLREEFGLFMLRHHFVTVSISFHQLSVYTSFEDIFIPSTLSPSDTRGSNALPVKQSNCVKILTTQFEQTLVTLIIRKHSQAFLSCVSDSWNASKEQSCVES